MTRDGIQSPWIHPRRSALALEEDLRDPLLALSAFDVAPFTMVGGREAKAGARLRQPVISVSRGKRRERGREGSSLGTRFLFSFPVSGLKYPMAGIPIEQIAITGRIYSIPEIPRTVA